MKEVLYIFLGGGAGSVLRFLLSKNLNLIFHLPLGTLFVNVLGSFILGSFLGYVIKNQTMGPILFLFTVGFCGGFTTFSAFAVENFNYLKNGAFLMFGVYTVLSLILTLIGVYLGYILMKS